MSITAYPLCWPDGWRRTASASREYGRFSRVATGFRSYSTTPGAAPSGYSYRERAELTISQATRRVLDELRRFGVAERTIIVSTNLELRLDGLPRSKQRAPADPGVAVYWEVKGRQRCIAVDRYTKIEQNLAAIAATLDAMRAIERHGGAEILDRAFTGFTALPSPSQWWHVLGLESPRVTEEEIQAAYRRRAQHTHPDKGGSQDAMASLNWARDAGLAAIA